MGGPLRAALPILRPILLGAGVFPSKKPEFLMTGIVLSQSGRVLPILSGSGEHRRRRLSRILLAYFQSHRVVFGAGSHGGSKGLDPNVPLRHYSRGDASNGLQHGRFTAGIIPLRFGYARAWPPVLKPPASYDSSKYRTQKVPHQSNAVGALPQVCPPPSNRPSCSKRWSFPMSYSAAIRRPHTPWRGPTPSTFWKRVPLNTVQYLKITASGKPFTRATPKQRLVDFTRVFGSDWRFLNAKFVRFIKGVD